MARSSACVFRLALCGGLAVACLTPSPAAAQFGSIFGDPPPRPPSEVPGRPPPRLQPPGPPRAAPVPPAPSPQFDAPARRPGGVQSQPLPPPPGAPMETAPQPSALPPTIAPAAPAAPPPRGTPQPANTGPQPGDEVITEMPTQKIANPTAVFSGLDKITGRITSFDVAIDETVQFGALQVTPRVCYTRPPTETPNTDSFIEVDEVTLQGEVKRIFAGWTFAASPGLRGVEHPIYDIWLTDCKGGAPPVADVPPPPPPRTATKPPPRQPARQPAPARQPQRAPVQPQPVPPPFR